MRAADLAIVIPEETEAVPHTFLDCWNSYPVMSGVVLLFVLLLILLFIAYARYRALTGKLLRTKEQAFLEQRSSYELLQQAVDYAEIDFFQCDAQGAPLDRFYTNKRFWGVDAAGKLLTPAEWVYPDDLTIFQKEWRNLVSGKNDRFSICYRVEREKHLRYFEMCVCRIRGTRPGGACFAGFVREISRSEGYRQQMIDMRTVWENVLDHLPVYFYVKSADESFRYVLCSRAVREKFGDAIIGKDDFEVFPPEIAGTYRREDEALVAGEKQIIDRIEKLFFPGGEERVARIYKKLLIRADGGRLILVMATDITDEMQQKETLEKTNAILSGILDNLPAWITVKDIRQDFRYLVWNTTAERLSGIPASEVIGKRAWEIPGLASHKERFLQEDMEMRQMALCRHVDTWEFGEREYELDSILRRVENCGAADIELVMRLDVTESKRLEWEKNKLLESLRLSVAQERVLNQILQVISTEPDVADAMRKISSVLGTHLNADQCSFTEYLENCTLCHPCCDWYSERMPATLQTKHEYYSISPDEPWIRSLENHNVIMLSDMDPGKERVELIGSWNDYFAEKKIRAFAAVALFRDGKVWGHIFLAFCFAENARLLTAAEQGFLQAVARLIEIIWENSRSRDRARQSEYEKLLIIDTVKIPIMLFDANHNLVRVNNAAQEIAGIPEATIYRQPCYRSFCQFSSPPAECPVRLALLDQQMHNWEVTLNGRDYLLTAYPIIIDGKLKYVLKTLIDMTDANAIRRKLAKALFDAQSANRAKSYFLATMSHEIRTPLNAVIGLSELLQNDELPRAEQLEYLQSINLAGSALLDLINDILDLSKIESEQIEFLLEPADVAKLTSEIGSIFRHKAQEKGLLLETTGAEALPILELDTLRLRQVLLNLLGNAMKYTHAGRVTLETHFDMESAREGTLVFRVSDTGIGIRADALEKIFQPFQQQESVRDTHLYSGTGLGLAIADKLISKMGGEIKVQSTVGVGSVFTVLLPHVRVVAEPEERRLLAEDISENAAGKILIVDDVVVNVKVLEAMLHKCGVEVVCASSAAEALELMERERPDMVLTDIWMPCMNGDQLAGIIRRDPRYASIPIVAVTADTQAQVNFKIELFDRILLKPITLAKLRAILSVKRFR